MIKINHHTINGYYLLSMIDHKSSVEVAGISLLVNNTYENNLRERNPQLGIIEGLPEDNTLNLSIGDVVAVHHFSFYGDVSKGTRTGITYQEHFEIDNKKYFRIRQEWIYFKYNNKQPEPLPGYIICTGVEELKHLNMDANTGEFSWNKKFDNKGTVLYGGDELPTGAQVLVLNYAFYLITLDRIDYFKVRTDEVLALVGEHNPIPFGKTVMVQYKEEKAHAFLDLSFVKKPNNLEAMVIDTGGKCDDWLKGGDKVQVFRNNGVLYENYWLINDPDIILWKWLSDKRELKAENIEM